MGVDVLEEGVEMRDLIISRFGERGRKAVSKPASDLVYAEVSSEGEVWGIVRGDSGEAYVCYTDGESVLCSCTDNCVRKSICKHVLFMVYTLYSLGKIDAEDAYKLINMNGGRPR